METESKTQTARGRAACRAQTRIGRRAVPAIMCLGAVLVAAPSRAPRAPELVQPNSNTERAGELRNGVLTVKLEAKEALYRIYGPRHAPTVVEAFAEVGKPALMPGPLVRAPVGTEIRLEIHNSLAKPITLLVPTLMRGGPDRFDAMDSVIVAPGGDGVLTSRPTVPGNYVYRATLPNRSSTFRRLAGLLAGALIVDSARASGPANDRVFVLMAPWDSLKTACSDTAARPAAECDVGRVAYTINGRSWPNTERVAASVGDSLHWRVIAATADVHPMHLHGFYYRIDSYSAPLAGGRGRGRPGQLVATQLMTPLAGMSMTWSPDRPGNWLFHCHFSIHLREDSISAAPDDPHLRDMSGLVIGINVAARPGVKMAGEPKAARQLRLIALEDSVDYTGPGKGILPSMHFVLEDGARRVDAGSDFSPELDLVRGEPVAITIVNRMSEPTSVHWHGVEIQNSYMDGAPGFSGSGTHLAPAIAPGDSFVARFTPPRSGTFIYHAHVDDDREQSAGLIGSLIVREPGTSISPDDHSFFLKSARLAPNSADPVEINGQLHPDTVVLHAGEPARLRLINLTAHHNSAVSTFQLQAIDDPVTETGWTTLRWQPIAKDGLDLPERWQAVREAEQVISIGETYDFAYTPRHPGMLRLLVSTTGPIGPGKALIAVPIRVERAPRTTLPLVRANPNIERAGTLQNGVLNVSIDAGVGQWRFSAHRPPMSLAAFAETGKAPQMPGPFLRVPAGAQIRFTVHNSLDKPLTFIVPAALHGGPDRINAMDSVVVGPGAVDTLAAHASVPGNYVYRGTVPDGVSKVSHIGGALVGAIVVDSVSAPERPHDRVFVVMATEDSLSGACDDTTTVNPLSECRERRFMYTINGAQWPNTDRVHAAVGDSLHWRVINASFQVHPMHLHGFYYRVDELSGPFAAEQVRPVPGQMVVTQLLAPLSAMSMTWSPDRPGNWLFHCHFALHNMSYSLMASPDDPDMRDMVGLVIGTLVSSRSDVVAAGTPSAGRRLRLVAESTPAQVRMRGRNPRSVIATLGNDVPQMRFVVEEHGRRVSSRADISPEIDLTRGEPVAITIVNHLDEPTTVHWHGIEVEDSYMDGAAGFSGAGAHLTPAIAPGDSFVARFTPPRSGTFMYHAHVDELREELAGLEGALIVRDSAGSPTADDDIVFLKGEIGDPEHPLEVDGEVDPDTVVLHAGHPARLRLLNLSTGPSSGAPLFWLTARPDSAMTIGRDTMLLRWTPVAKDGFDLPAAARSARPASEVVSVGETFDFEYTPAARGTLQLEVRGGGGNHPLLIRVPIRVE